MKPCYDGPNPVSDEDRYAIWKWAKENGIDAGEPIEKVHDAINQYFFAGQAKEAWITDIMAGRKTPFRKITNEVWRKQYNRSAIIQQAADLAKHGKLGTFGRALERLRFFPRALSVSGHGIVFPITHAGDLAFTPSRWGTFIKGTLRAYHAAGSSAYSARLLHTMSVDPLYELALRSGVDVGPKSAPVGIIENTGKKTGYFNASARSWDALTAMRFELWKQQVSKHLTPGMTEADQLDIGQNFSKWANHATGSAKGPIASIGGDLLFGPKLTQSKLNRLTVDPAATLKTFANWKEATPGEKAVAWTRLSGAAQYAATTLGFLAVNQGVVQALGSKEKVNWTDPTRGDYFAFKGGGVTGYIPGMHTEIRTLAKLLNIAFMATKIPGKRKAFVQNPALHGESKFSMIASTLGQYGMAKAEPGIQRGLEVATGQNWLGRPVPWSSDPGTPKHPRMTAGEYAGSVGPIPLEGPIGYFYDHLKKNGASSLDASAITKGLIIFGAGAPGFHVHESYEQKPKPQHQSRKAPVYR